MQSAVGHDYVAKVEKHESQTDASKGFGGKFGVQTDRQDAAAVGFDDAQGHVGTNYEKTRPVVAEKGVASSLRSRFETLAQENKKASQVLLKLLRKWKDLTRFYMRDKDLILWAIIEFFKARPVNWASLKINKRNTMTAVIQFPINF